LFVVRTTPTIEPSGERDDPGEERGAQGPAQTGCEHLPPGAVAVGTCSRKIPRFILDLPGGAALYARRNGKKKPDWR